MTSPPVPPPPNGAPALVMTKEQRDLLDRLIMDVINNETGYGHIRIEVIRRKVRRMFAEHSYRSVLEGE